MIKDKQTYLTVFHTTEQTLEDLVGTALAHGGDYADLFFENTTYSNLMLRDGQVSSGGFHVDFGVGIRVLKGEKTGYAYSESTDPAAMASAARAASAIAQGSTPPARVSSPGTDIVGERLSSLADVVVQHLHIDVQARG